jgi:hypothetical protein
MMKTMDHAVTVETTSNRNDQHKTWLHLNMTGKEWMANLTGKKIKTLLAKERKLPIIKILKESQGHYARRG